MLCSAPLPLLSRVCHQVRDQRVRLVTNDETGLIVQPVSDAEKQAVQQQGVKAQQFMMTLSMEDWKIMKQLVPACACIMPHRAHHSTTPSPQAGAAAGSSAAAARVRGSNKRARTST